MESVLQLICLSGCIMDCNWTETGSPLCVSYDDSLRYKIREDASLIYKGKFDNWKVFYTAAKKCLNNLILLALGKIFYIYRAVPSPME